MLPYTLGVLRWLKISPFLILAPVCAICQVQVTVPAQSFKASERIAAKVANVGDHEILYCVEFGQTSFKGPGVENTETTPIPFYVQRKSGGRCSTLMIGPDVGSARSSVVLEPGQSHEFPFRLNDKGEMRLVLEYWIGEKAVNCKAVTGASAPAPTAATPEPDFMDPWKRMLDQVTQGKRLQDLQ
jgi:hypothetical protein